MNDRVYRKYAISDATRSQVEGFTYRALFISHQAALRQELARYGYRDRVPRLTDQAVMDALRARAAERADTIQRAVNRMLANRLKTLKATATDAQREAALRPVLEGIRRYNRDVMARETVAWVRDRARKDFIERNGISATFRLVPEGAGCPRCTDIAAGNPYGLEQANGMPTPVHPNCFIAGTVIAGPSMHAVFERPYQGPVISIRTAAGNELTGTPNHPVLTPEGWIALGALKESDSLFRCTDAGRLMARIAPDEHQIPALIEQVFCTASMALIKMPVTTADFHGDGIAQSQVNIVLADCGFNPWLPIHHLLNEHCEAQLVRASGELQSLPGEGDPLLTLNRQRATTERFRPGSTGDHGGSEPHTRGAQSVSDRVGVGRQFACQRQQRLTGLISPDNLVSPHGQLAPPLTAHGDTGLPERLVQRFVADARLISQRLNGFTGLIARDQIVQVRERMFSGHVYNASTSEGWYAANGLIVSNCQHSWDTEVDRASLPSDSAVWAG